MEIADWLRGLSLERSLERYAEMFRDNAIDVAVLPELSESDLENSASSSAIARASIHAHWYVICVSC